MLYISYYSAFSLFTMSYNYPKKMFFLVEVRRIELLTPCLQSRCSPSWAIPPFREQISARPNFIFELIRNQIERLVGLGRLELPTLRLSGVRSNHLSYKPSKGFATLIFFLRGYADGIPFYFILWKEVIQPQVPLRLPCYDFAPIADPTVVASLRLLG